MITVDLKGPQGNAFYLMGYAQTLADNIGVDAEPIIEDMQSGDYGHLCEVFLEHFGDYVELVDA